MLYGCFDLLKNLMMIMVGHVGILAVGTYVLVSAYFISFHFISHIYGGWPFSNN